jgi:hypothetical protein
LIRLHGRTAMLYCFFPNAGNSVTKILQGFTV